MASPVRGKHAQPIMKATMQETDSIQNFYRDTTVLVTGGTGFLGKLLVEKLLRSFPDIRMIYMIVRSKKGFSAQARLAEYFDQPVFSRLAAEGSGYKARVRAINGDCSIPGLGIGVEDTRTLQREVQVVIHAAATVRFDELLSKSIMVNVQATQSLLELARFMKELKSFVYISTAFSHSYLEVIPEKILETGIHYDSVIKLANNLDHDTMIRITPGLTSGWPNAYTFSKYLAEQLVDREARGIPVGVFRPGIVISTYQEPFPGWIDNMYGPTGVMAGAMSGLIRCAKCHPQMPSNVVPADWCVNGIIASAWDIATRTNNDQHTTPVYNYGSSDNPLTWMEMNREQRRGLHTPLSNALWYFSINLYRSNISYNLATFFLHIFPAFVLDAVFMLFGKKMRFITTYQKVHKFLDAIGKFSTRGWYFQTGNMLDVWNRLDQKEREMLPFSMPELSWPSYFESYLPGIAKHLLGQCETQLPAARRRYKRLYVLHQCVKLVIGVSVLFGAWKSLYIFTGYFGVR